MFMFTIKSEASEDENNQPYIKDIQIQWSDDNAQGTALVNLK